jgi:uncharacterized protein (DUF58 family)
MSELPQTPESLLRRLEWSVLRRLDGLLHGSYRTLFRGDGLDLADLREYQLHDDVRHIDWNVTARLQQLHVRQYNEDREVITWFLLDLSPSMDFGSTTTKRENLIQFAAVLARVLTRHGNPVGVIFYGDGVEAVIPPRTGRNHVLHMMHLLMARPTLPRASATALHDLLESARQTIKRRSLVFLISDFITQPGWAKALGRLSRRNEVIAIRLSDPAEHQMPEVGMAMMQDAETGEQMFVDTQDAGFRRRFAAAADRRETEIRDGLGQAGVDALEFSTDDDLFDSLIRFAALRKQRRRSTVGLPRHLEAVA